MQQDTLIPQSGACGKFLGECKHNDLNFIINFDIGLYFIYERPYKSMISS